MFMMMMMMMMMMMNFIKQHSEAVMV